MLCDGFLVLAGVLVNDSAKVQRSRVRDAVLLFATEDVFLANISDDFVIEGFLVGLGGLVLVFDVSHVCVFLFYGLSLRVLDLLLLRDWLADVDVLPSGRKLKYETEWSRSHFEHFLLN